MILFHLKKKAVCFGSVVIESFALSDDEGVLNVVSDVSHVEILYGIFTRFLPTRMAPLNTM